jgi:hypothetical protein
VKLREVLLKEVLMKEFCNEWEESLEEAVTDSRLAKLLDKAEDTVFKPFGIKPSEPKYFIAGSARLYLYPQLQELIRLKPIGDLDMVVPNNVHWDDFKKHTTTFPNKWVDEDEIKLRRLTPTEEEDIEVFDKWLPKYDEEAARDFEVRPTEQIMKDAKQINGYYYMSLYDIMDYKLNLKRDKEKALVGILMKYKNASSMIEKDQIRTAVIQLFAGDEAEARDFLAPAAKQKQAPVVAEKKGTCCHKCGHVHVKGTPHPTPYFTGKKNCKNR